MKRALLLTAALLMALATPALADTINVPADYATIQGAVDAASSGDVIMVAAGTYPEQIKIDGKSLDIVGAGSGSTIVEAVDLVNRTTYTVTKWTAATEDIDPCIGIVGPATVNVSGLTVDGRDLGPDHFYGIFFHDADGSVVDCVIDGILYAAGPSASKVASLVATHSETGSTTVTFQGNTIPDFQKGGILVMGPNADVELIGNTVIDVPTGALAGNGIQISYGATGSTYQNVVQGSAYTGDDWAATGVLLFESGDVTMDEDEVFNCQSGVNYSDWGWVYLAPTQVVFDFTELNLHDNDWTLGAQLSRDGSDIDIDIIDCVVTNSSGDGIDLYGTGVDPWGGTYYTGWDNGNLTARIVGCTITNTTGYDGIWTNDGSGNLTNTSDVTVEDCHFENNVSSAVNHGLPETMDADLNYWGDPDGPTTAKGGGAEAGLRSPSPFGIEVPRGGIVVDKYAAARAGDAVYGPVNYSPWYAAAPGTSPMPLGTNSSIQAAIDAASAGATISVSAGTYDEMLDVDKPLTLRGANWGIHPAVGTHPTEVVGARGTETVLSHNGLYALRPSADDITVDGFMFTGDGGRIIDTYDDANNLHLTNCIFDNDAAYASQGVIQFGGGSHTGLLIDYNLFETGEIALLYAGGGPWDGLTIEYNLLNCEGDAIFWAGTPLVDGVIRGNEFDGTIDGTPGTGFCTVNIGQAGNLLVEDNWIHDVYYTAFQVGIIGGDVLSNVFERVYPYTGYNGDCFQLWGGQWGTAVSDDVEFSGNRFYINDAPGIGEPTHGVRLRAPEAPDPGIDGTTIICRDNLFIDGGSAAGALAFRHEGDTSMWVDAEMNWWGDGSGPYHVSLNPTGSGIASGDYVDFDPWILGNIYCDPDPEYLTVADPTKTIAVKYLGGGGGAMFGYNISIKWDGSVVSTSAAVVNEGSLLSDIGGTFFYAAPGTGNEIIVDCALLGSIEGATDPGTLFTIDFTGSAVGTSPVDITILNVRDQYNNPLTGFSPIDGTLIVDVSTPTIADVMIHNTTLTHTDDYIKDTDGAQVTATVLDDDPAFGTGDIVADLQGLGGGGAVNPDSYNWTTGAAVWTIATPPGVTCTPANGDVWVYVDAADAIGNPATQGSDKIISDNIAPTAVTDFDAAPGHQKCDLSWAMGSDTYLDGVVVQRTDNAGDYPLYATFKGAWPTVDAFYAGDHTLGTNVYDGAGTSAADAVVDRNIYYYQAFCYDIARNYGGAASTARDLATNYWLGDVASAFGTWGYNGLVNDDDIDKLGSAYHQAPPGSPEDEMDVGPTVHPDYNRLGLPFPDTFIGFEDLMIFAMNYGMVAPRVVPLLSEPAEGDLALSLEEIGTDATGLVELALRLEGNLGDVKGVSAVFELDGMEFISGRLSDEMSSPAARTFFWAGDDQVDLAILGTDVTIGGCGELARLTFQANTDDYSVGFAEATIRGADNAALDAELEGYAAKDEMPKVFGLAQNTPNPFNPMTTIAYNVPQESQVAIRVYDVSGRVVRTLVDGVTEPGRHAAVWDGRNDHGEHCGSGVYFCVMETPEYRGSHKMMLLK